MVLWLAQNTLAMLPMLAITMVSGEVATLAKQQWSMGGIAALVASCLAGLGMSYFSFALRAVVSATSFSVIGNVCKVLTILVNILMWDNHASAPSVPPLHHNLPLHSLGAVKQWRSGSTQNSYCPSFTLTLLHMLLEEDFVWNGNGSYGIRSSRCHEIKDPIVLWHDNRICC